MMPIQKDEDIDLELIAKCLERFLHVHSGDARLSVLSLDEDSIKGKRIKKEKNLWFLGKWAIQDVSARFKATWSTDVAPAETILITLDIEKSDKGYEVIDWNLKHILF